MIAWSIFALSVIAIFFGAFAYLFFAWLTATPLTPVQLAKARWGACFWLVLVGVSLVVAIISLIFAIQLGRRTVARAFDVVDRGQSAAG